MMLKAGRHSRAFTLIETIITLTVIAVFAAMIYTYFGETFIFKIDKPAVTRLKNSIALQRIMENIRADYNGNPKWRSAAAYTSNPNSYVIPTNDNGHQYKCTMGGTSGTAEPNWPSAGTVTDGSITWTASGTPCSWRSGSAYANNSYVSPTIPNGHYYRCTTAGVSGTTEPSWPTNNAGTVTDNSITWTESGSLFPWTFLKILRDKIGVEGSDQTANNYGINPDGTTYTKYNVVRNSFTRFVLDIDQDSRDINGSDTNRILKVTLKNDNGETLTALFFPY